MSSREIAELTGKGHRNVMRDIRTMLDELHGEGGVLSFEQTHRDPQNGQTYPIFALPKRETLILVSGYSVVLRAKIIDRWQEREAAVARPALPNFGDAGAAGSPIAKLPLEGELYPQKGENSRSRKARPKRRSLGSAPGRAESRTWVLA